MERKDIDSKYKWDLSHIYESDAAFEAEYAETEKMISAFPAHEKTINKSADGLYAALCDLISIERKIEKMWNYAFLTFATDTANNKAQGMTSRR